MKITIIGTGRMGKTLGGVWAANGHEIIFGSRGVERVGKISADIPNSTVTTIRAAALESEVALLAIPWYAFTDTERAIGDTLDGKIVIDCINPFTSSGSLALGHKRSAGEDIQNRFHRSFVVKAFNHLHYSAFNNPIYDGQAATAFYCSNFDAAKAVVVQLANEMGFDPIDAGPIKNARLLEPLAALWAQLAYITHHGTENMFRFVSR